MTHSLATGVVVLSLMLMAGCARNPGLRSDSESPPQPTASPASSATQPPPRPSAQATPPAATRQPGQATPPVATPAPSQPTPQAGTPKPAALDLSSLEQRLRETKAIGALTKIALKNQVDDLLDQFRTYYQGKRDTDLAHLRRSYDLLLMKFLSLLQDEDKPLANAIVASREEIWGILSDRTKFATL